VDPRCIRRELAEATDMTVEELDAAAHELMLAKEDSAEEQPYYSSPSHHQHHHHAQLHPNSQQQQQHHNLQQQSQYSMHNVADYRNKPDGLGYAPPAAAAGYCAAAGPRRPAHADYTDADNDDMVYVTTL
jgi:hypothetical protein